jgi:Holliday junction resolvase RusA-like endonuclease
MTINIPIRPIGKARARVTKFGAYTPEKTKIFEQTIKWEFIKQFPNHKIILKPLKVSIIACFKVPKSYSKQKAKECLNGERFNNIDIDNIAKAILDGLNNVAYKDDRQILELNVIKKYGLNDNIEIILEELGVTYLDTKEETK